MLLLLYHFISFIDGFTVTLFILVILSFEQMMELVNKIIYNNIYNDHGEENAESQEQSQAPQSIREGMLLLHRGGLASFKWMKYVCPLIIEALLSQNSHRTK